MRRQAMRAALAVVLFAFLASASGCGSAAVGAVMLLMPEASEDEALNPNAPNVIITDNYGVESGDIAIHYSISDNNADVIDLAIGYSLDSGISYATMIVESTDPSSEGTTQLASSHTGTAHLFVWDSMADLGTGRFDTVRIRIMPYDPEPGTAGLTADFTIDNTPPSVEIKPFEGTQSGNVTVAYKLSDGAGDQSDIIVEYSTDGGTSYHAATEDTVSAFTEGTTQLASSPDGILHIFVWDSVVDCAGFRCPDEEGERTVRIKITPSDLLNGLSVATPSFALDNNIPPTATVETPGAPLPKKGMVQIDYTLFDPEGDDCDITVIYAVEGGVWGVAMRGSGGDPLTGLTSSATGVAHTFVWNSIANLGYCSETTVYVGIVPKDFKEGTSGATGAFTVDNNLAPSAVIVTPSGVQSGATYVLYYLFDGGGDKIDISVNYSIDSGQTWATATLHSSAIEGTTDLDSAPSGYPHLFLWDTAVDMLGGYSSNVIFRIKPTDIYANEGDPAMSDEFTVSNNSAPSITVTLNPLSPSSGDISVEYDLIDSESDDCTVVIDYRIGAEGEWQSALLAAGSEPSTGQLSLPGGYSHTLIWDSASDIDRLASDVEVRITPYDYPGRAGDFDVTDPFDVDNAQWAAPTKITSTNNSSLYPSVHASEDGHVHLVWQEYYAGKYDIMYSTYTGNSWSAPQNISSSSKNCFWPDVVAGASGTVHVVWNETDSDYDDQVMYRKYDGSKWLTTDKLTNSNSDVKVASIELDDMNRPWVVYPEYYSAYYDYAIFCRRHDGTNWLTAEVISTNYNEDYEYATIRRGPDGTMHVCYRYNYTSPSRIVYNYNTGAGWSSSENIYSASPYYLYSPHLAVDKSGYVHSIWARNGLIAYANDVSGSWSVPEYLTSGSSTYPRIVAYSPSGVHAVWERYDDIEYRRYDGASWSTVADINTGTEAAGDPYMRMGLDNRIHLAYNQYDGGFWQIFYTRR